MKREIRDYLTQRIITRSESPSIAEVLSGEWTYSHDVLIRVVAKEGTVDDWAAYAGSIAWEPEWIVQHGLKLREKEAVALFPLLNPAQYRH